MQRLALEDLEQVRGGSYNPTTVQSINPELHQKYISAKEYFDKNFSKFYYNSYDVYYKNLYILGQKPLESFLTEQNKNDPIHLGDLEGFMDDFIKYVNNIKNGFI